MSNCYLITNELCSSCLFYSHRNTCDYNSLTGVSRIWRLGIRKCEKGYCCEYTKLNPDIKRDMQIKEYLKNESLEVNKC